MSAVVVPTSLIRDIAVSSGASELVWTQLTELAGVDVSGDTFMVALVPAGEAPIPIEFVAPTEIDIDPARPDVVRLALLVDATTVSTRGDHTLWARVVDVNETLIFPASGTVELS